MGVELYPAFRPPCTGFATDFDGQVILTHLGELDKLARKLNIRPLTSFMDTREPPKDYDGGPENIDEVLGDWHEWFQIKDAIASIQRLVGDPRYRIHNVGILIDELETLRRFLAEAEDENRLFRLECG
ncbi:hypothetical protein [Novipirellula rosea]|uniref:Uncharacterized protein n=1 Tax=Novipirellula rosea TaxID=1031540 RepID=A0ABP8NI09_9BACT